MEKSRCGVSDSPLNFSLKGDKYTRRQPYLNFPLTSMEKTEENRATHSEVWFSASNPDIPISCFSSTESPKLTK